MPDADPTAARVADLAAGHDRLEALARVKRRGGDVAEERGARSGAGAARGADGTEDDHGE